MEIWGTSKEILRRYRKIDDRRGRQIHGRYVEIWGRFKGIRRRKIWEDLADILFRTRNLGQHFFDISKKNYVNQSLASLINDKY
jgi:hypothetical protein